MLYSFAVIYIIRIFTVLKETKYKPLKIKNMKTSTIVSLAIAILFLLFMVASTLLHSATLVIISLGCMLLSVHCICKVVSNK